MNAGVANTAYLVAGVRTPFGRYGGALAPVRPDDLAAHPVGALTRRLPSVDWAAPWTTSYSAARTGPARTTRNVARMAVLLAGLPVDVPGATVNRLCGSGRAEVAGARGEGDRRRTTRQTPQRSKAEIHRWSH